MPHGLLFLVMGSSVLPVYHRPRHTNIRRWCWNVDFDPVWCVSSTQNRTQLATSSGRDDDSSRSKRQSSPVNELHTGVQQAHSPTTVLLMNDSFPLSPLSIKILHDFFSSSCDYSISWMVFTILSVAHVPNLLGTFRTYSTVYILLRQYVCMIENCICGMWNQPSRSSHPRVRINYFELPQSAPLIPAHYRWLPHTASTMVSWFVLVALHHTSFQCHTLILTDSYH